MEGGAVSLISRICFVFFVIALGSTASASTPNAPGQAVWTVMVFLNGDNNLEPEAVMNFRQMANVGSDERVNIIVQFDRLSENNHLTTPDWSQTLRFRVTRNMEPIPSEALEDIGEANMGDPKVLADFIKWARSKFPAQHYMLVIWDHGQGYRVLMENRIAIAEQERLAVASAQAGHTMGIAPLVQGKGGGSYRTISQDDTNHDKLYAKEIQDALSQSLGSEKLDVIGYDACLMSMVETGYSLRSFAKVMVGSEDLEPGPGWNYEYWLKPLTEHPEMTGADLGKTIVDAYARNYAPGSPIEDAATTLSAIDLSKMDALAGGISTLSEKLSAHMNTEKAAVQEVRDNCQEYAAGMKIYHIDFGHFLGLLADATQTLEIKMEAKQVRGLLLSSVIANYAGSDRKGDWGSTGLAIYFPKTLSLYKSDPYAENGYEKKNAFMPVEFVQKQQWADFLHAYWMARQ
jgi:hypothetical protein